MGSSDEPLGDVMTDPRALIRRSDIDPRINCLCGRTLGACVCETVHRPESPVTHRIPVGFPAFEETAVYVEGHLTRSQAITEARDLDWRFMDDYRRSDLRVRRVLMRAVEGEEAEEFFLGEFDNGWVEVSHRPLNAAQRRHLTPMWKVEPRA